MKILAPLLRRAHICSRRSVVGAAAPGRTRGPAAAARTVLLALTGALAVLVALSLRFDGVGADAGLDYFEARTAGNAVILEWRTTFEADHYAFDILRSETNDYTAAYYLDTVFAEGDPSGAEYEYEDWSAEYGVMYYYWLESYASRDDFEPQGVFGPVQARAGIELPKAVFLPHVMGHRTLPPTPTPLPYPVPVEFSNREDLPIPDTGEPQTSTITVPDVFAGLMSHVQVFVNIFHPDAGDLQVVLVSPQGTRFMLHRRFEYDGTRNLRREFWIQYGLFGLPFHGTWALEVTDRVESAPSREPTPVLAQWELTIFALPTPAPTPTASP